MIIMHVATVIANRWMVRYSRTWYALCSRLLWVVMWLPLLLPVLLRQLVVSELLAIRRVLGRAMTLLAWVEVCSTSTMRRLMWLVMRWGC
jgi:hypothetical protein